MGLSMNGSVGAGTHDSSVPLVERAFSASAGTRIMILALVGMTWMLLSAARSSVVRWRCSVRTTAGLYDMSGGISHRIAEPPIP